MYQFKTQTQNIFNDMAQEILTIYQIFEITGTLVLVDIREEAKRNNIRF